MKILVDMDSTLNCWHEHFLNYASQHGWEIDVEKFKTTWSGLECFLNVSLALGQKRWNKILCDYKFWRNIPIKPFARSTMEDLVVEHDVWIVTAPYDLYSGYVIDKFIWISNYLPFFDLDKVIFEKDKWTIPGDVIIEDKPKTLKKYPGITICFDYPYNRNVEVTHRVKSWKEIANILT